MDQSKENASQYSDEQKATFIKLLIKYLIENFRFPGTYIEDRSFWDHVHSKLQDSNEAPDSCCTSLTGWVKKDWKMKTKWNELNPVRRQCLLTSAIFNKAQLSQTDEPIIQRLEGIVGAFLMAEHLKFFEFQAFCIGMLCGLTPPETEVAPTEGKEKVTLAKPKKGRASGSKNTLPITEMTEQLKNTNISVNKNDNNDED